MRRHERPSENLNADKARGMRKVEETEFDVEEREGVKRTRRRKEKTSVLLSRREQRERETGQ